MVVGRELWRHVMKSIFVIFGCGYTLMGGGVRAQRVPTVFRGVLQNLTVEIGRTATFACDILTSETTGWKHNGDLVYLKEKPMSGGTESRYSTNYVSHVGTHVLRIANVTADDDGPVECIVKWGNGDNDWTKSTAHLTVLVPPSDVEIRAHSLRTTGGMHTARMDEMVNFSCIVYGGRPTPNLVWYRGARRIEDGADRSGYTLEESSDGSATHSSLSFKARSSDNEADFTCQAESPALVKPHAASVRLEVLYPPATPVIRATGEVTKVRAGESDFRLVCVSDSGNPAPKLTWFRNNLEVEGIGSSSSRRDTTSILTFVPRLTDNNVVLKCEAVNELMPRGLSVETHLMILFGPAFVALKAPTEVKPGDQMEINCTSGPSNPAAKIAWKVNNRPYPNKNSVERIDPDGLYITYSTLIVRLLPDESADDISVACQAVNPETNEISRTSAAIKLFPKSGVRHPALSNRFSVYDAAGNELEAVNGTDLEAIQTGTKSDNFAMIVAVSASVSCAVFFTILGCLLYVVIRGRGKKFEEMASSDSSGSKSHPDISSQNGRDSGNDTTASEVEKTPADSYSSPKSPSSPSMIRANAACTYLLDEAYHSPYETYKHWSAPGCRDAENEGLAEYDGEEFYVENLRRTARQSMQPHLIAHSPAPLRALPYHAPYGSLHKASVLSTFNGQSIPTYRAEALVDELKGHLV